MISSALLKPEIVKKIKTKFRRIVTKIPVPESLSIFSDLAKYEARSMHGQLPIVWDRAEGSSVYDSWGNKWIDFTSTIFVANAGHSNKRILNALKKQINKPLLHTYTYANHERRDYLKYLIQHTPKYLEKAFLLSAGTEATECALKLMRMNGKKQGKRRLGIIAIEGNWHGRTMGAQMMSCNPQQKKWIGFEDPNIFHVPFPYPWNNQAIKNPAIYFEKTFLKVLKENELSPSKDICGIMIETFQGWGAVFYPKEYISAIKTVAKKFNFLVTFDEMQSGFGRTGKLFGFEHYKIKPDLVCLGKGVASGLPLSIVMGKKEILDLPETGSMSSTHSANPLVCVAGKANLEALLKDDLIVNARILGKIFFKELNKIKKKHSKYLKYVLGKGLVAALHFKDNENKPLPDLCNLICKKAMQKGLILVNTGRESIKLAPPLSINEEPLREGIFVLEESIQESIQDIYND